MHSIAESLDAGGALRTWLATQTPADGDVDLDYAFVRAVDGEHVSRELDTRALTRMPLHCDDTNVWQATLSSPRRTNRVGISTRSF